jgi:alanine dehydrogenase
MHIGIPKEIKNHEYRVALTPEGARELSQAGHEVSVEADAGAGAGFSDDAYRAAGAVIVAAPADAWAADLVVKGTIWRWKRKMGQDFSDYLAEFEAALSDRANFDMRERTP